MIAKIICVKRTSLLISPPPLCGKVCGKVVAAQKTLVKLHPKSQYVLILVSVSCKHLICWIILLFKLLN